MAVEPEVEKAYEEFWRPVVAPNGPINLDQVKRELHDYLVLLEQVPPVYTHVTQGRISKPNTFAESVISVHDEVCKPEGDAEARAVCEALLAHERHGGAIPWPSIRRPFERWKTAREAE